MLRFLSKTLLASFLVLFSVLLHVLSLHRSLMVSENTINLMYVKLKKNVDCILY